MFPPLDLPNHALAPAARRFNPSCLDETAQMPRIGGEIICLCEKCRPLTGPFFVRVLVPAALKSSKVSRYHQPLTIHQSDAIQLEPLLHLRNDVRPKGTHHLKQDKESNLGKYSRQRSDIATPFPTDCWKWKLSAGQCSVRNQGIPTAVLFLRHQPHNQRLVRELPIPAAYDRGQSMIGRFVRCHSLFTFLFCPWLSCHSRHSP